MPSLKQLTLLWPKLLNTGLCLALALMAAPLRAAPAAADVVITDCASSQGLSDALNGPSGRISFSCGLTPVSIFLIQAGGFNVLSGSAFTIDGGNLVTLSGGDANRLFWVQSGAALTLTNITLSHGNAASGTGLDLQGGAILNDGGALALNNAIVRDSQSTSSAGAIENASGTTVLIDSLIENNQSDTGGGIDSLGTLMLSNTIVRSNHALTDTGGGLNISGTAVINNSLIVGNTAEIDRGGGIFNNGTATLTLTNSSLRDNSAIAGGGIYNDGMLALSSGTLSGNSASVGGGILNSGVATLTATTLSGNLARNYGGGLFESVGGLAALTNVTLSGNSSRGDGGGIYNRATVSVYNATIVFNQADSLNEAFGAGGSVYNYTGATFTLRNSLVAWNRQGNAMNDCAGTLGSYGRNLVSTAVDCNLANGTGGLWSILSPLASIGSLQNNGGPNLTHMPRLDSQMINGGDPAAGCLGPGGVLLLFDQRGQPRTDNASFDCDIGSVERQPNDSDIVPQMYLPLMLR